ncbi:MAG: CvpA family protein [Rikenellaceae bacterium]
MMNYIDIIVLVILAIALFSGFKQGIISQLCSIVGIIIGIWLAIHYGAAVGEMLNINSDYAFIAGMVILFLVFMIAVALVSRVLKGLFKFVGLGIIDGILGAALSVCKYALILSLLFGAFDGINKQLDIVNKQTLDESKLYHSIIGVSDKIFPALKTTQNSISRELEKL